MNYNETISYLYSRLPVFHRDGKSAYKPGLENVEKLDKDLEYPHRNYKTIHIAGTNGKGSVSNLLASVLQHEGYKVGLYTSPHLKEFRERIRINGKQIPEQYVCDFVKTHRTIFENINLSFFELTMSMAFKYFADEKVEIAIIEAGLGGRLDSTNIITPILSVITNISFDHMNILGDTLSAIASEKAGIIKPSVPVVIGESKDEIKQLFIDKANSVSAPILFAENEINVVLKENTHGKQQFNCTNFQNLTIGLGGLYQQKNTATTLVAIQQLNQIGLQLSNKAIYKGFETVCETTGLQGRWQKIQDKPTIICDIGHNEEAIRYVNQQLQSINYKNLRIVIGIMKDKDIENMLKLLPKKAIYYFCKANTPRALDEKEFQQQANVFGLNGNSFSSVELALNTAKQEASIDDLIFVGGSNFVVAEVV